MLPAREGLQLQAGAYLRIWLSVWLVGWCRWIGVTMHMSAAAVVRLRG